MGLEISACAIGMENVSLPLASRVGRHALPLLFQTLHVDFRHRHGVVKRRAFSQHRAVFRYQMMAGKHQIRRRLPFACIRVHIARNQLGGLRRHQLPAKRILADYLVAGR